MLCSSWYFCNVLRAFLFLLSHTIHDKNNILKISLYLSFYPSALGAGGVLSSRSGRAGGWPGGRLPNLQNPYLCNRLMDFLHSKFCGIVQACSCAPSWSFAHLPHMGLPMGQKLVKFGTNWVQTLQKAYLWNCWMDWPHLKFHGLVWTCSCALS